MSILKLLKGNSTNVPPIAVVTLTLFEVNFFAGENAVPSAFKISTVIVPAPALYTCCIAIFIEFTVNDAPTVNAICKFSLTPQLVTELEVAVVGPTVPLTELASCT